MNQNKNSSILKIALILFAVVAIVYGLGHVFFPESIMKMSGGEPVHPSWLRWPGCVLIALGIGAIMILRNPAKQDIFVIVIGLGTLLVGLALLYSLIFEMTVEHNTWFTAMPTIVNLVMSGLICWGRQQAKGILKQE